MALTVLTTLRVFAALLFTAFNLIPLYGIHAWGWDAFQLLLLYWGETAILFACTLAHIAVLPPERLGNLIVNGKSRPATRAMMVGFFALHGGMFIAIHLLFLCVLFAGNAFKDIHSARDFIVTFIIASGAWVALTAVALAGIIDVLTGAYHPAFVDAFARSLHVVLARPPDEQSSNAIGSLVGGLYLRIFIMQAAIIFGGMAAQRFGSMAPLVIVITMMTLVDIVIRVGPALKAPAKRMSEA
jgi:hypothetical protein